MEGGDKDVDLASAGIGMVTQFVGASVQRESVNGGGVLFICELFVSLLFLIKKNINLCSGFY